MFFAVYQIAKNVFSHPRVTRKQDVIGSDVMGCVSDLEISEREKSRDRDRNKQRTK